MYLQYVSYNWYIYRKKRDENLKTLVDHQNTLYDEIINKKQPVTIFLVNGVRFTGIVQAADKFTILFKVDGKQQMIYKQAISTIMR